MDDKGSVLMRKYELGSLLGRGTFAKVHHAWDLKTGLNVAIKIIDKEKVLKVGMMDQIKREISVTRLVRHPNVVQIYEVMASRTKIYFVMEYVKGGELFDKVAKGKLEEDAARKIFQQLIGAVDFCHSRGVYHRDLKPENLLLDKDGNLKVSDFGLTALAESKRRDGLLHTACGTPAYASPEVISRIGYDGTKADIWSCGVILYVLLAGYLPFRDSNLMEMYRKICQADFKFPKCFSPEARRLLVKILDPDPSTRISIPGILKSSWFQKGFIECNPKITDDMEADRLNADGLFGANCEDNKTAAEVKEELEKPSNFNAFDIISLSSGFDLTGLFEDNGQKRQVRFSSRQTAKIIVSKIGDMARRVGLRVRKKDGGLLKLEGGEGGRKGALSIEAEIFELTPTLHLVEVKKSSGDTLEYLKLMKQDIRPALKDIIWTWEGDQLPPQQHQQQDQFRRV
ncbi:CBL-interacting protein kinase 2-like [Diospyros lotus]|uniref:CBL-interacting protein kinase 2-like n=1 Tax=Diospyros lotus TaxID=55363 RepID=UPI0022563A88|nr:CBL-interacting protein kinase 2-like [Diospyros lotus]